MAWLPWTPLALTALLHAFESPVYAQTNAFDEALGAQGLLGAHFGRPGLSASFDYVVIGGGTAGLTTARRLAANTSLSVAVIEAGDFYEFDNGNLTEIPADAAFFVGSAPTFTNPLIDWEQHTLPQTVTWLNDAAK